MGQYQETQGSEVQYVHTYHVQPTWQSFAVPKGKEREF